MRSGGGGRCPSLEVPQSRPDSHFVPLFFKLMQSQKKHAIYIDMHMHGHTRQPRGNTQGGFSLINRYICEKVPLLKMRGGVCLQGQGCH